jgi:hypothetical protein
MKTIPSGMIEVSKEQFFAALNADARDIMPSVLSPDCTRWETKTRQLWGWSLPGWKHPERTSMLKNSVILLRLKSAGVQRIIQRRDVA